MKSIEKRQSSNRWHIACAFIAGLGVAFHIGKIPGALPNLKSDLGLDLLQSGWIVSSSSMLAAVLGLIMALLVNRKGARFAGTCGLLLTGIGSCLGALTNTFSLLMCTRIIEGIGFLMVVVTMPTLIAQSCNIRDRSIAMGIWGAFIPLAMVLMMLLSPLLIARFQWQGMWWFTGLLCLIWAIVFWVTFRELAPSNSPSKKVLQLTLSIIPRSIFLVASCFICYSALYAAMTAFLPTFWSSLSVLNVEQTSYYGAIAISGNIAGNITAGFLYGKGVSLRNLLLIALFGSGLCACMMFVNGLSPYAQFAALAGFTTLGGMLPGSVFASIPDFATHQLPINIITGLVFQGAGIGQMLGPVLLTATVSYAGHWESASLFLGLTAVIGALLAMKITESRNKIIHKGF